jgi:hypothetical protein
MSNLIRWFIKSAFAYFIAALFVGVIVTAHPVLPLPPALAALGPVYFHLFMVGWVTQLIFGIAHWMFPKYSKEKPRGNEWLMVTTYLLLNGGLLLRAIGEPLHALWPTAGWGNLVALSAVLQWLAGVGFVYNTWPRIKEK